MAVLQSACSTLAGSNNALCRDHEELNVFHNERFDRGPKTPCHCGREWNGRWIRPALRAREPGRRKCHCYRAQEARHLAPQAERGSAPGLRGLLRACGRAVGSRCSSVLPGRVYRGGAGSGTPHDNRELYGRVRASFPREQSRGVVLIFEREWRGLDGKKSDSLRTIQGRG